MKPYQLSKNELQKLNQGLADLTAIREDLERAKMAGVPNIEHLENACQTCEDRINALKAVYAGTKK